ncbi:hypothetical protein CJU89_3615 [Yarrowia sp. B02]|nr:hypothetical protein CJU89_3615 [Yarrowia sp. B02]
MLQIHNDGSYTTFGKTYPIPRHAMFSHLVRKQAGAKYTPGPPSWRDIPDNLTVAQKQAWDARANSRQLCEQQEQIIKGFMFLCGPMVCQTLLQGPHKNLQTAILDYSMDEWIDAVYKTLSRVIPWWHYNKHHLFDGSVGAKMHSIRLMWLYTCIGPRDSFQEQQHLELIGRQDIVEMASEIQCSPPITPTDRETKAFIEAILRTLETRVPNGYLHTLFHPNTVIQILQYFGYTSCLDMKRFFDAWRDRENDLLKWMRRDMEQLCPRDRSTVIPKNFQPHDVAMTFNTITATYMRHNAYAHDRDLSLPECFDKYGVLRDYYTESQLMVLQDYVEVTSNYILHHLNEDQVEEAVEMLLTDLESHPHLTFSLKAMKREGEFSLSHLTKVIMAQLRYVEIRLEFLRAKTTDGESVSFPDFSGVFVLPTPSEAIEIDDEQPPPPPPIHIRHDSIGYESNLSKSHEIAKRNAHKWVSASTNAVKEYLQSFEMFRDTNLCKNCLFSRRHTLPVSAIAHETKNCKYPNLWEAMRECGLRSVDFDLEKTPNFNRKITLGEMNHIKNVWMGKVAKKREAFEEMAAQMPIDSCNNCLFQTRTPRGGFAIMHRTEACRNLNIYQRLFDYETYPYGGAKRKPPPGAQNGE